MKSNKELDKAFERWWKVMIKDYPEIKSSRVIAGWAFEAGRKAQATEIILRLKMEVGT